MITLDQDGLVIRFPDIATGAGLRIDFQRTLRIPDDGREYPLPPGLGRFPLRHIEDFDLAGGEHRKARGGLIMPMFQTDALWINFHALEQKEIALPVALKIGAGKINAISGTKWKDGLSQDPQNYVVTPEQPWLDGFNVGKDIIRQFVAMPLGEGYTVEEQIDPDSNVGGIQIEAIPMKKDRYEELCKQRRMEMSSVRRRVMMGGGLRRSAAVEMGLGMGGSMRQEIYNDKYGIDAWDQENRKRCFVMLANAKQWMAITGEEPPLSPISAAEYSNAGLPWFEYYGGDKAAIEGAKALGKVKSIRDLGAEKGDSVWPVDKSGFKIAVKDIGPGKVSDGSW